MEFCNTNLPPKDVKLPLLTNSKEFCNMYQNLEILTNTYKKNDEESTQLIIKLDNKLAVVRTELENTKKELETAKAELEQLRDSIKQTNSTIENIKLKEENKKLENDLNEAKQLCIDLIDELKSKKPKHKNK
jgi:archaellum component FlaC